MDPTTSVTEARNAIRKALNAGTSPGGLPAALIREHETLKLYFYEPRGEDRQTPHEQDEVYVIVRGSGTFAMVADSGWMERRPFGPGDAILVPAGTDHRFEDFTDDFGTWVIMYGPPGGEARSNFSDVPERCDVETVA